MQAGDINVAGGLVLDISRQEEPVTVDGKRYVMREWFGGDKTRYEQDRISGVDIVVEDNRKVLKNAKRLGGNEALLVSLCLFEKQDDGKERNVPEAVVQGWPGRVQTALYNLARKVCRMDDDETLEGMRKQHEELGQRIKDVEARDPKESLNGSTRGFT